MATELDPTSVDDDHFEVIVPLRTRYASTVRVIAASLGAEAGFTVDEIDDVRLALDEVFSLLARTPRRRAGAQLVSSRGTRVDRDPDPGVRTHRCRARRVGRQHLALRRRPIRVHGRRRDPQQAGIRGLIVRDRCHGPEISVQRIRTGAKRGTTSAPELPRLVESGAAATDRKRVKMSNALKNAGRIWHHNVVRPGRRCPIADRGPAADGQRRRKRARRSWSSVVVVVVLAVRWPWSLPKQAPPSAVRSDR